MDDEEKRAAVAARAEQRPRAPADDHRRAGDQHGHVGKEDGLNGRPSRDQQRRRETAEKRHARKRLRPFAVGEQRRARGDDRHRHKRHRLRYQRVEMQRGVDRNVKDDEAGAGKRLAEERHAARAKAQSCADQQQSRRGAGGDSKRLADPAVVERELHEVADAEDDGRDAGKQQPASADQLFEAGRLRRALTRRGTRRWRLRGRRR